MMSSAYARPESVVVAELTAELPDQVMEFLKLGESKDSKSASWGANVILFTSKSDTAPLTKSLASQFEGKIAFGESRASNKALAELFKVTRYIHH